MLDVVEHYVNWCELTQKKNELGNYSKLTREINGMSKIFSD